VIAEFRELFRINPEWQRGHDYLAKAFMAKRDYPSAIAELKLAVLQNPTGAAEHRVLGQVLLLSNQPGAALRELRLAVELDPDSAMTHRYLGTALFETQDLESAAQEFRQALKLDPSADNHYYLAACLMSLGRDDEALAELQIASTMNPTQTLYRARMDELRKLMQSSSSR
jgi:tetratricopeptide (TPR) repeat protein